MSRDTPVYGFLLKTFLIYKSGCTGALDYYVFYSGWQLIVAGVLWSTGVAKSAGSI